MMFVWVGWLVGWLGMDDVEWIVVMMRRIVDS